MSKQILQHKIDYDKLIKTLYKDGVCVIPVLTSKELKCYNTYFYKELEQFPEYKENTKTVRVLGGFGGLGNPSSFHNTTVRTLRIRLMFSTIPLLSKYPELNDRKLEQLIDRMSIRRVNTSLSKESWHRDVSKDTLKDDIIFGGWINLDLKNSQKFSCVKGTQILNEVDEKGFAVIPKSEHQKLNEKKSIIDIPPGHQIIFYQNIIHEVIAIKQKTESIRLYCGFRLTHNDKPLIPDLMKRLKEQAIIPLPSGQLPPMYSMNHISLHKPMLLKWSKDTFPKQLLEHKTGKDGIEYNVITRFMKSLKDLKLKLYLDYSESELVIYRPNKSWDLLLYDGVYGLRLN
jgi:hypothetical protein